MLVKKQLKRGRKGFTLVEVIVVLVILAILAAIAIPALTGYINRANEKAVISQTRTAVVAAQTILSDAYGEGKITGTLASWIQTNITYGAIQNLTGDGTINLVDNVNTTGGGMLNGGYGLYQLRIRTTSGKYGYFIDGKYDTTTPGGTWTP